MNSLRSNDQTTKPRRRFWAARGQSYVELAFALPVLAIILVVAADFGRLFYTYIEVINAARAGAQYGSNSVVTAANAAGMIAAAKQDGVNLSNLTVTASQCTCRETISLSMRRPPSAPSPSIPVFRRRLSSRVRL
jgi:Flp pilus assembly protein TadG